MNVSTTPHKRLFIALWPDQATQLAMHRLAQQIQPQCGGNVVVAEHLHITLAFLGNVSEEQQYCMEQACQQISLPGFDLQLNQLGYFNRAKVAWLAPEQRPAALEQLVESLNLGLIPCGFQPETRPYHPHVTLLRKAQRSPMHQPQAVIEFICRRFVLVESLTHSHGVEYRVLREWALN